MNSKFMMQLPDFIYGRLDKDYDENATIDLMKSILEYTNTKGPVVKNSIPLHDKKKNDESLSDAMFINNEDDFEDSMDVCTTHFGGSSQTETKLGTAWLAISNAPNTNEFIETSMYYIHALPVFEEMMNSCTTKK